MGYRDWFGGAKEPRRSLLPTAGIGLTLYLIFAASLAPAAAQGTAEQRNACQSDAQRLCNNVIPDVAKVAACLSSHRGSLSSACLSQFSRPSREQAEETVTRRRR